MIEHSIVIPVFNEEERLMELYMRLSQVADELILDREETCEIILINDGSTDNSPVMLDHLHVMDPRFKILHLTRRFGLEAALSAGIEFSQGRTISVMNADLQDPPEVIPQFIRKWKEGYDIVYGLRQLRSDDTWLKIARARFLHGLSRRLLKTEVPLDAGDFLLMSQSAAKALLKYREKRCSFQHAPAWLGFRQTGIPYERDPSRTGSRPSIFLTTIRSAWFRIFSFSCAPLRIPIWIGISLLGAALTGLAVSMGRLLYSQLEPSPWTWLGLVLLLVGGAHLLFLGIIGEYVGKTLEEVGTSPLYRIQKTTGLHERRPTPRRMKESTRSEHLRVG